MPKDRQVSVTTPFGEELQLLSMSGSEQLGRLFRYDLMLRGKSESLDFDQILGEKITVALTLEDGSDRYFNGVVSHFGQQGRSDDGHAIYVATVQPDFWLLSRTSDCRIFQEMTVPDIIKEVFGDNGLSDYEVILDRNYQSLEYCVQYRESDFHFISRLMEQEGIYYFFRHEEGKHTLVLADGYNSHEPIVGEASITFHQGGIDLASEASSISHWVSNSEVQPGAYVIKDFDFTKPKSDLTCQRNIPRQHSQAEGEMFDYPGGYIDTGDGEQYTLNRIEEHHVNFCQSMGDTDCRSFASGGLFSLVDHPREDQNHEYLIIACDYDISANSFMAGSDTGGERYQCGFTAISGKTVFRPRRITPKPVVNGPQTAIVVGPAGAEIYPDEYGRVKVQFHWDRLGENNENSSCWVRVAQTWAGPGFGAQFIPRIGHEVMVEFLEGDPDRPIITGRVYNADNMPTYSLPGNKTQSGIKTRSSPGGAASNCNEIRLEDKAGSEEFYVQAEKDYNQVVKNNRTESTGVDRSLEVGNDKNEEVGNDKTVSVANNQSDAIGNNKSQQVGNDKDISVGNNETIVIGTDQGISVGANKTVKVGADHKESIGSSMTINVGKNLTETVAINYAETVGAAMELTIGGVFAETVGANKTQTIGGSSDSKVGGDRSQKTGGSQAVDVAKDLSESIGDSHSVSIKNDYILTAKKMFIKVKEEINITTGKASISMKKDGTISIKGKDLTLDGSGNINIKAKKDIVMKGKKILQN